MNALAYLIHFGGVSASGVIGLLINLLVFALVILVIFWVLGLLGVPSQIQRIIAAILALILILSLFAGCAPDSRSAKVWTPTTADNQP